MRIVVLGGWGQLGTDLTARARSHDLIRPRHADVDVTDEAAVRKAIGDAKPDAVINAAAFHKVEQCQDDPAQAFAVNALGALHVARAAADVGARTMHVSTDYVFGGDNPAGYVEDAAMSPLNVYGISKAAGEMAVLSADSSAIVVRGSGLFGHAGSTGKGGNFVDNMLNRLAGGEALSIVDDQVFAPTATHDMADRMLLLLEHAAPAGTYHVANEGRCSWYELARCAAEIAGVHGTIEPRPTGESPVRRPAVSVLLDTRSRGVGLPPNRTWQDALRWYLASHSTRFASGGVA